MKLTNNYLPLFIFISLGAFLVISIAVLAVSFCRWDTIYLRQFFIHEIMYAIRCILVLSLVFTILIKNLP